MRGCTAPPRSMTPAISSSKLKWSIGWCHVAGSTANCAHWQSQPNPLTRPSAAIPENEETPPPNPLTAPTHHEGQVHRSSPDPPTLGPSRLGYTRCAYWNSAKMLLLTPLHILWYGQDQAAKYD